MESKYQSVSWHSRYYLWRFARWKSPHPENAEICSLSANNRTVNKGKASGCSSGKASPCRLFVIPGVSKQPEYDFRKQCTRRNIARHTGIRSIRYRRTKEIRIRRFLCMCNGSTAQENNPVLNWCFFRSRSCSIGCTSVF